MCPLILCIATLLSLQLSETTGSIDGVVLNISRNGRAVPAADVLLRASVDGEFIPVARAQSDAQGRFSFRDLPVDQGITYLPGATCDEIHYPGTRIVLTSAQPHAQVRLTVQEAITQPNPLVISDYQIYLEPEAGALRVTEQLLIENPEPATFVGLKPTKDGQPVTLQLRIPSGFEKVTFHEEFYGRRFVLINSVPTTSIPWPSGQRVLRFSYVIREESQRLIWNRPLDLPCRRIQLHVQSDIAGRLETNLRAEPVAHDGLTTFTAGRDLLPAGHTLQAHIKNQPLPFMAYARWIALALLSVIAIATLLFVALRRRTTVSDQQTPQSRRDPNHFSQAAKSRHRRQTVPEHSPRRAPNSTT